MIIGIGTDILEINRLLNLIDNKIFITRYYTDNEINYLSNKSNKTSKIQSAAAMFCAKEATSKAIGTGFSGFSPKDIEVLHDKKGKPYINLSKKANDISKSNGINYFHLSLTHCREYAAAYVIAEGDE